MFCKKCGTKLKDGAAFCTNCGTKVTMPSAGEQTQSTPNMQPVQGIQPVQDIRSPHRESSGNKNLILIILTACIVFVLAAIGIFFVFIHLRQSTYEEMLEEEIVFEDDFDEFEEEQAEDTPSSETEQVISDETSVSGEEHETAKDINEEMDEDEVHTYELIVADVTWTKAYSLCLARGGHLVRINSDEEMQAILQQIKDEDKNNIKFWIGGVRDESSYTYHWVYEESDYEGEDLNDNEKYASYWLDGEPSYMDETTGVTEMYMNMFYISSQERWVWNDTVDDILEVIPTYSGTIGYICEYEN